MLSIFWKNLKEVLAYSPLVLSETDDPKDVSIHRYMAAFLVINLVIMAYLLFFISPQVLSYSTTGTIFGALSALLGTYVVANIGKRYIKLQEINCKQVHKEEEK